MQVPFLQAFVLNFNNNCYFECNLVLMFRHTKLIETVNILSQILLILFRSNYLFFCYYLFFRIFKFQVLPCLSSHLFIKFSEYFVKILTSFKISKHLLQLEIYGLNILIHAFTQCIILAFIRKFTIYYLYHHVSQLSLDIQ